MKTRYIKILTVAAALATVGFTSCKKYLDVNESPNGPKSAQQSLILPSTQAGIGAVLGNNMEVYGSMWGQYWTQNTTSSQYKSIDSYTPTPASFNRVWGILYSTVLEDLETLIAKQDQYSAVAYIQKAYTFQLLTDAFGDVPLKETMQGEGNLFPHYDSQKDVYDSIIAWTKKGIALANNSASFKPGKDDIIFGGNMNSWKSFGNTLLLRAYLRLSEVDAPKAQAGIAALYATTPTFLTTDAKIAYISTGGNQNPLYAESVGLGNVQNLMASSTAVDAFKANKDFRIKWFYLTRYPNSAGIDSVFGNPQGQYNVTPKVNLPAYPSTNVGGRAGSANIASASAPVILIGASEASFLQAEAIVRGWATGDAATILKTGITTSFTACGIKDSATNYIAKAPDAQFPADKEGRIKTIITQKYYAMCGIQGFEAWTEWRRTGYPGFLVDSKANNIGAGNKPQRFLYPDTEVTRNTNFPGQKNITDKVWWDVK